jgi:CBS domain-containing protein
MAAKSVSDVMRQRFVHVTPGTSLSEAFELMELTQLQFLLVVEDERLIGIVSHGDLSVIRVKLRKKSANGEGQKLLEETSVELAMKAAPETVRPTCSLAEAEKRLISGAGVVIPVTTGRACTEKLVGIVTESDLSRSVPSDNSTNRS